MDKLFSDSETFTKVRPTKITEQQEQDFFKSFAQQIIDNNWSDSDLDDVIEDVSTISSNDNGYEIAKHLEDSYRKASYEIDVDFVEFLDSFGHEKSSILEKNIKEWVEAHNPQPKFKKGQKLVVQEDLNYFKKKGAIVYVTGFQEKYANYLIDENIYKNGGTIIPYEKIENNCKSI